MIEFTERPVQYGPNSIEFTVDEGESIADLIMRDEEDNELVLRLDADELASLIASAARALAKIAEVAGR